MEEFTMLISNVGFPIVMCILMYRQSNTAIKNNTDMIESLKDEIKNFLGGIKNDD